MLCENEQRKFARGSCKTARGRCKRKLQEESCRRDICKVTILA